MGSLRLGNSEQLGWLELKPVLPMQEEVAEPWAEQPHWRVAHGRMLPEQALVVLSFELVLGSFSSSRPPTWVAKEDLPEAGPHPHHQVEPP